jgi:restriction endonuclease S subunit
MSKSSQTAFPLKSIRELVKIKYGKGLAAKVRNPDGQVPVFGSNGVIGVHSESIAKAPTIIIGRKGSVGEVNYSNVQSWPIDTSFYIDEYPNELDPRWLFYCLKNLQLSIHAQGPKPGIKRDLLYSTFIPFPADVNEQRRIVARIEELTRRAEEARKLRQEAVDQIGTEFFHVRRKIYQSLLAEFPTKPLGKCGKIMGGGTPSKKRDDYWQGDIPWVAPKEMKTFRITASSEQITEVAISESSAKLIPAGSVLFVVRGMILARYIPVAVSDVPCAINQDMKAIVPAKGISADYLAHMLWGANDILQGMVETAGHGTKKLETPAWSNLKIPVPDTEKQKAVIDELTIFQDKLSELELLQTETEQELEQFQSALLAKAFRGEL